MSRNSPSTSLLATASPNATGCWIAKLSGVSLPPNRPLTRAMNSSRTLRSLRGCDSGSRIVQPLSSMA